MTPGDDKGESSGAPAKGRRRRTSAKKRSEAGAEADVPTRIEREELLEALEAGLAEALPGVEILDRDLSFDERARADLAAVDPLGRLVLVLVAEEDPGRSALDALDLAAFAHTNSPLIGRHLASRRVDSGLEPRIVVIDPSSDEELARRLGALERAGIEVFGVRTLSSQAGERAYLVAHNVETRASRGGGGGVQAFLDALPLPVQDVGRSLAQRMARLDEDVLASADHRALVWRHGGEVLARLEVAGDRLLVSLAPDHAPAPLRAPADVEDVLEGALARLVERFEDAGGLPGPEVEGPPRARDFELEGPILTEEEIQAFQE